MHSGSVGRTLDLGSKVASWSLTGGSHCLVSLSKTLYLLLSTFTSSTQEDPSWHGRKIVDWDVMNIRKQTKPSTHWSM